MAINYGKFEEGSLSSDPVYNVEPKKKYCSFGYLLSICVGIIFLATMLMYFAHLHKISRLKNEHDQEPMAESLKTNSDNDDQQNQHNDKNFHVEPGNGENSEENQHEDQEIDSEIDGRKSETDDENDDEDEDKNDDEEGEQNNHMKDETVEKENALQQDSNKDILQQPQKLVENSSVEVPKVQPKEQKLEEKTNEKDVKEEEKFGKNGQSDDSEGKTNDEEGKDKSAAEKENVDNSSMQPQKSDEFVTSYNQTAVEQEVMEKSKQQQEGVNNVNSPNITKLEGNEFENPKQEQKEDINGAKEGIPEHMPNENSENTAKIIGENDKIGAQNKTSMNDKDSKEDVAHQAENQVKNVEKPSEQKTDEKNGDVTLDGDQEKNETFGNEKENVPGNNFSSSGTNSEKEETNI